MKKTLHCEFCLAPTTFETSDRCKSALLLPCAKAPSCGRTFHYPADMFPQLRGKEDPNAE